MKFNVYKNMYMCILDLNIQNIFYKDRGQKCLKAVDLVGVPAGDTQICAHSPPLANSPVSSGLCGALRGISMDEAGGSRWPAPR